MHMGRSTMAALAGAVLLLCAAAPAVWADSSASASSEAYASGGDAYAKADASAHSSGGTATASASAYAGVEEVTYEKPEEYKEKYGEGKPYTAPKLDVTPYHIHKPVEVYHEPPECPLAAEFLDCEKCTYCDDSYPWYDWLFYHEWEKPETHESDYCDVVEYKCEKSCETYEYCEPECETAYKEECDPECKDVPYKDCDEDECYEYEDEECHDEDCTEPEDCDKKEVCKPDGCSDYCPDDPCESHGRRLLDLSAFSEALASTGSEFASGTAYGMASGGDGYVETDSSAYVGDGEASSSSSATAKTADYGEDYGYEPECTKSDCEVCECHEPECKKPEPCTHKVCKPVKKTKCEPKCVTKYKKECKDKCVKVPKHDCKDKCYTKYTGKCELLCVEEEEDPLYCYCTH